jgi:hypothetical protein
LIVMPNGYGSAEAGPKADATLKDLDPPGAPDGDKLGRAAIDATVALAKAHGKAVPAPKIAGSSGGDGGGTSPAIIFGVPVALLALGGVLAALRARQEREKTEA